MTDIRVSITIWLGLLTGVLVAPAAAQEQDLAKAPVTLTEALTGGETHFNLRYRYEYVDQDFALVSDLPFTEKANASTLRVRLNYRTGVWNEWSAFGEFDYIGEVLLKDFNNLVDSGRDQYPVVADPKGADLNQLYVEFDGFDDSKLRFGRQKFILDDGRYIGSVGWRQNEQTYDSVSGKFKGLPNTELFYAYVGRVNRILGERSPAGKDSTNTHLLNAKISLARDWSVIPYFYYIDSDDFAAFSTSTFGARATGKIKAGDGNVSLTAEVATQSDAGNAPVSFRAQYYRLNGSWALDNGLSLGLGLESLGGDENVTGKAFRTPLATLHAFQGWADQFLVTPNAGVDDFYFKAGYKTGKWTFAGAYHDFSAQSGSASWGSEFDVSASRSLDDRISVLFKGAFFRADDTTFSDVTKFWIMLTANY